MLQDIFFLRVFFRFTSLSDDQGPAGSPTVEPEEQRTSRRVSENSALLSCGVCVFFSTARDAFSDDPNIPIKS